MEALKVEVGIIISFLYKISFDSLGRQAILGLVEKQ